MNLTDLKAQYAKLGDEIKRLESAPRDGTWVLIAWLTNGDNYGIPTAAYFNYRTLLWTNIDPCLTPINTAFDRVTHWQPLPKPPTNGD